MDIEKTLKEYRKKSLADPGALPEQLDIGRENIVKILPHRDPFLLIDRIIGLDLANGIIAGDRYIDPSDPVFAGHFPGYPVYPGVLEIEMIGQLGLCLYHFTENKTTEIGGSAKPVDIRATRVLGAHYLAPVLPGKTAVIIAKSLDFDGFFGKAMGQILVDGTVCCTAVGEVVFP